MKKMWMALLSFFLLFGVACEGEKWMGCSQDEKKEDFNVNLGKPGETKVENNLPHNENVKILKEDEKIQFVSESGEAIITHSESKEINENDIIIANADQQYLLRVKTVISRDDGSTQVILRQASLQDIVGEEDGSIRVESTPVYDLSDIESLRKKAKRYSHLEGVTYQTDGRGKVTIRDLELFNINLNSKGRASGGANRILGVKVKNPYEKLSISSGAGGLYRAVVNEAVIEVVPTVRSHAEWSLGRIKDMETRLDTRVKYRVDITYEAAGEIHMEGLLDYLMPKKVVPVRLPGPPPIYLDIELGIPVGVAIKAETKGKTRVIFESEYEFYSTLAYDKQKGSYTESDKKVFVRDTKIETKDASNKLSAEVFLKPQITTRLYRVLGPYAFAKLFVRGELEWPSVTKKDDLYMGVRGGVGMEVSEPIFLTSVASYEIDDLFNFTKSFDLDNRGDAPVKPKKMTSDVDNGVTIDQIGKEGFVRFLLKEAKADDLRRYQIIKGTKTGLLVPADGFFMNGEIYYYPLPNSEEESFTVRIFGEDGTHVDREITIQVSPEVRKQVSMDRFGTTTNSYKVASGTPGDFAGNVPSHDLGGGPGIGISESAPVLLSSCFDRVTDKTLGDLRDLWGRSTNCTQNLTMVSEYTKWLTETVLNQDSALDIESGEFGEELMFSRPFDVFNIAQETRTTENFVRLIPFNYDNLFKPMTEPVTNIKNIEQNKALLETWYGFHNGHPHGFAFDFYNLFYPGQYIKMKSPEIQCLPAYHIDTFEDKLMVGIRLTAQDCPGVMTALPFNIRNFAPFENGIMNRIFKWNRSEKREKDRTVLEFSLPKATFFERELSSKDLFGRLALFFPLDPSNQSISLESGDTIEKTLESLRPGSWSQKSWIEMFINFDLNHEPQDVRINLKEKFHGPSSDQGRSTRDRDISENGAF